MFRPLTTRGETHPILLPIYTIFTEIKIQRAITHTFYHTFTMKYSKALLSNMSKPLMPQHGLLSRDHYIFCSIFRNHRTIAPVNNSATLQLVQSSNPNSTHQYQCSSNHLAGVLLEHCLYTCIIQLAYKNQISGQCRNMQNTRKGSNPSTLQLQLYFSTTNDSSLPIIPQEDITTIIFLILIEPLSMGS